VFYESGAPYPLYGNTKVTQRQLRGVRAFYAGILSW
jgi:hypothetical protein